ncbi:phosphate transporter PHO1 homolog 3 [Cryptomeria japonica]|uniref:phosphate transporter PHO1 homolog 3 n=1 Tax=Cryptomeria japonica TaxID=3369 RepID=UPI0027DA525C|nr:phosphate transporter PHO1 homolog 3 [Cryptomeria japonica]
MKFGKEFVAQMVPEWHEAYMDYNFLKTVLKDITRYKTRLKPSLKVSNPPLGEIRKAISFRAFSGLVRRGSSHIYSPNKEEEIILSKEQGAKDSYETTFLMAAEEGGEYDVVFFKRLDEELNKVNSFYRSRVEELVKEATELDKQMSSLLAFRAIVRNKPGQYFKTAEIEGKAPPALGKYSGPSHMEEINEVLVNAGGIVETESMHTGAEAKADNEIEMTGRGLEPPAPKAAPAESQIRHKLRSNNKPHPIEIMKNVKIRITPDTPRSTIRNILNNPENQTLSRRDLRRGNEMVRTACIEFYEKLTLVKSYSSLNLLAFSKIMKKYDKVSPHAYFVLCHIHEVMRFFL